MIILEPKNGKKEMLKRLRDVAETVTAGKMIFRLVRFYCSTFRLTIENEFEWIDHYLHRGNILICPLHQQFLSTVCFF